MAVLTVPISADATIYQGRPVINAGGDAQLEFVRDVFGNVSHVLIDIDRQKLADAVSIIGSQTWEGRLQIYSSHQESIPNRYTITVHSILSPWLPGTGKLFNSPNNNDGVTWYTPGTGSLYATASLTSQSFSEYSNRDISIVMTSQLALMGGGAHPNGYLLRLNPTSTSSSYRACYYSHDTSTIYQPVIRIVYQDTVDTGSLLQLDVTRNFRLSSKLSTSIRRNETYRIPVSAIYTNPIRNFVTGSLYRQTLTLPVSQSYYRLVDVATDRPVFDYHPYCRINRDDRGSYLTLHTHELPPWRYYRIEAMVRTPAPVQSILTTFYLAGN